METINSIAGLREFIKVLEAKQQLEKNALKDELRLAGDRLKPANLIKNALQEYARQPDLSETVGLAAGYLTKKTIVGSSDSPIRQLLGGLLQMGVSRLISKNADGIKDSLLNLADRFLNKKAGK